MSPFRIPSIVVLLAVFAAGCTHDHFRSRKRRRRWRCGDRGRPRTRDRKRAWWYRNGALHAHPWARAKPLRAT